VALVFGFFRESFSQASISHSVASRNIHAMQGRYGLKLHYGYTQTDITTPGHTLVILAFASQVS